MLAWFSPVALAFALWAYFHPRKRLKLEYQTGSTRYFEKESVPLPPEAVMTFQGEEVERLARTTVVVWNAGTEVLRGEDIVPDDPLRARFDQGSKILVHAISDTTNEANQVAVKAREEKPNELELTYDYLNPRDGLVLHVIHDGQQLRPTLVGTVKGLSGGPRSRGGVDMDDQPVTRVLNRVMPWCLVAFFGGALVLLMAPVLGYPELLELLKKDDSPPGPVKQFIKSVMLPIIFAFMFIVTTIAAYNTPRRKHPRTLVSDVRSNNSD